MVDKPRIVNTFPPGEFRSEWHQVHLRSHQQIRREDPLHRAALLLAGLMTRPF